ncbi:hypothetical protein ABW20_dc0103661 [Dactylellina cionopaga]|nr:hypothetical protein ABW20_dc0103661 [Dactylellina cionopaga]
MLFSLVSILALGAASLAHPVLEERSGNGCNADNVLRLLRATQRIDDSLAFCSDYLGLPLVTETAPAQSTASVTITQYRTETVTETLPLTKTSVQYEKRGATTKSISTPGFILSTTIEPSRLSSACNCLTIPLATTTVFSAPGTASFSVTKTETFTTVVFDVKTTTVTAPKLVLTSPTSVPGFKKNEPAAFDLDDTFYDLEFDFQVEVYGYKSNHIFVSVNGLLWLDDFAEGNYWFYFNDADNNGAALPLGPDDLPDVAILPFWSDLFINGGYVQGIWYQVSGSAGSKSVTLEYIVSEFGSTNDDYHFTITLSQGANANKVFVKFYNVLDSSAGTVAVQHKSDNKALVFSRYGSAVVNGLSLEFDTSANTIHTLGSI